MAYVQTTNKDEVEQTGSHYDCLQLTCDDNLNSTYSSLISDANSHPDIQNRRQDEDYLQLTSDDSENLQGTDFGDEFCHVVSDDSAYLQVIGDISTNFLSSNHKDQDAEDGFTIEIQQVCYLRANFTINKK